MKCGSFKQSFHLKAKSGEWHIFSTVLLQCIISSPHPSQALCDRKTHVYVCVIVWHKGSLTASNSLSSGSCCRVGAWWPIPPAPYFSFNDAQINSSTLFQNSFSSFIPRPLSILPSTPPFHPDTRPSTTHPHLPLLGLLQQSVMVPFKHVYLDSPIFLTHFWP